TLPVHRVRLELVSAHGPERVQADVERDLLDVQASKQLLREVQARRRRRRGAFVTRIQGLVAPGVAKRLVDVGRERRLAVGPAREPQPPAPIAEGLEEFDRAEALTRPEASGRPRERLPELVPDLLEQQDLPGPSVPPTNPETRRDHLR